MKEIKERKEVKEVNEMKEMKEMKEMIEVKSSATASVDQFVLQQCYGDSTGASQPLRLLAAGAVGEGGCIRYSCMAVVVRP